MGINSGFKGLTLWWPAGHICPTYKRSFQVRWDNSIPLFLHAAICLEVYLFPWTSQNAFSHETAVYKWYCVQCCIAALHRFASQNTWIVRSSIMETSNITHFHGNFKYHTFPLTHWHTQTSLRRPDSLGPLIHSRLWDGIQRPTQHHSTTGVCTEVNKN